MPPMNYLDHFRSAGGLWRDRLQLVSPILNLAIFLGRLLCTPKCVCWCLESRGGQQWKQSPAIELKQPKFCLRPGSSPSYHLDGMGKWDSKKKGWGWWREFHVWLNRISEGSSARHSGLKDPGLVQLWHRLQLPLGSDPRPGNSICCGVAKK